MNRVGRVLLLSVAFAALAAGCRTAPIMNVTDAQVVVASGKTVSTQDVAQAITRAGESLGWRIVPLSPGQLQGTLNLAGRHIAVVDIAYSTKSYSIRYKESVNLNYTGSEIHPNYNVWVQQLDNAIRSQLLAL